MVASTFNDVLQAWFGNQCLELNASPSGFLRSDANGLGATLTDEFLDEETPNENPNLRILREKAKQADRLESELAELRAKSAELERSMAFQQAGVDPNDPAAKYFVKGYDGDLSPEAIKAAAVEARLVEMPVEAPPAEEVASFDRFGQAGASASTQPLGDDLYDRMRGKSPEEIGQLLAQAGHPVSWEGPQSGFLG